MIKENILNEILKHLAKINKFETDIGIASVVLEKLRPLGGNLNLNIIQLALQKLVKDGYADTKIMNVYNLYGKLEMQDCYMISYDGLFYIKDDSLESDFIGNMKDKLEVEIVQSTHIEKSNDILVLIDKYFDDSYFFNDDSFEKLKRVLEAYLQYDILPNEQVNFQRLNIKAIGWKFNRLLHERNKKINVKFLRFAISNINLYKHLNFEDSEWQKSSVYVYFHQKTIMK